MHNYTNATIFLRNMQCFEEIFLTNLPGSAIILSKGACKDEYYYIY